MDLTRLAYIGRDCASTAFQKVLFLLKQGSEAIGVSAWETLQCLTVSCIAIDMAPG